MNPLELAAFSAWPTLETDTYKGWCLRFDKGYTKRANSANASDLAQLLDDQDIDQVEQRFRSRGLRPVFRITSTAHVQATEDRLIRRGYRWTDLSLVMTVTLEDWPARPVEAHTFTTEAEAWLSGFQAITGQSGADLNTHLGILHRIQQPTAFAIQTEHQTPVCCGLGVVVGDLLGLFDIATHPSHWGRGLARQLCRSLLSWGQCTGARTAFLQVLASNTQAIALYEQLGFRYAYHYGYRVRP